MVLVEFSLYSLPPAHCWRSTLLRLPGRLDRPRLAAGSCGYVVVSESRSSSRQPPLSQRCWLRGQV